MVGQQPDRKPPGLPCAGLRSIPPTSSAIAHPNTWRSAFAIQSQIEHVAARGACWVGDQ